MTINDYHPPITELLTYGECNSPFLQYWPNYFQELNLTADHIPELLQMATDSHLHPENAEGLKIWAPIHAWRTLGQLAAQDVARPGSALAKRGINGTDLGLINQLA